MDKGIRRRSLVTALALLGALSSCSTGGGGGDVIDPGGGTIDLSITPSTPFDQSAQVGVGTFSSADYTLTNVGDVTLDLLAIPSAPWVVVTPAAGEIEPLGSAVVTFAIDAAAVAGMGAGEHLAQVDVLHGTQQVLDTIAVRLVLTEADAPLLSVTSSGPMAFTGPAGGPFTPLVETLTVTNVGSAPADWQVTTPSAWVGLSTTAGSLAPAASAQVQVFPVGTEGMGANESASGFVFVVNQTNGAGDTTFTPTLTIDAPEGEGVLSVLDPTEADFGGPVGGPFGDPAAYQLTNVGTADLEWSASANVAWLSFSQTSGTLAANQSTVVTVAPQGGGLGSGTYSGSITFAGGGDAVSVGAQIGVGTYFEDSRFLVLNGEKTLPIYIWNQPPWEGHIDYLQGLGITTYMNNGLGPAEATNPQLLDELAERGMNALLKLDTNPVVLNHPALIGWVLADEPDGHDTPASEVQAEYDGVRAVDPVRPIVVNLTGAFFVDSQAGDPSDAPYYDALTDVPEIVSFDHYPVTGWNQPGWVYRPGAATEYMLDQFVDYTKPCWTIVEASDQRLSWTPPNTPGPSPLQTRFQVWDSVIHGATAIGYFTIAFNPFEWANLEPAMEVELARTNGQLTALTDVILSPTIDLGETVSEPSGHVVNHTLRERDGVYYLFATNADMDYGSSAPTFTFGQPIQSVTVIDEGRTITPSGASFTDSFGPLEVHLYEVRF